MELIVLDKNLIRLDIIDTFESSIWTDRYCGYGDFEVYTALTDKILTMMQPENVLLTSGSEHGMIIEGRKIKADAENGTILEIKGRSLESILDRRIVWDQTILSGSLQNGIQRLLNENIIDPTIIDRKIDNFIFEASTDPAVTVLEISAQITRANLYETIAQICAAHNLGFKISISADKKFVFNLYAGKDRSYNQIANPYVIFSPKFENVVDSTYEESISALKTVSVVAGEDVGPDRKAIVIGGGASLDRRELYTDARDLSQTVDGVTLSDAEYQLQLALRGTEKLGEHSIQQAFDGQVDAKSQFKYGTDFFMGDIVQIDSGYGIKATSRVTELIRSHSTAGEDVYPTFTMIDNDNFETSSGVQIMSGGGLPTSSYTAADILKKLKTVDGAGSGLDADLLDGLQSKDVVSDVRFGTTSSATTGWFKIKINSDVAWMLMFKISVYAKYEFMELNVSGYHNSANWYSPKAMLVTKTPGYAAPTVHFGYDSSSIAWVAIPANKYAGINVSNIANGNKQISNSWKDTFEIVYEATLTGTIVVTATP